MKSIITRGIAGAVALFAMTLLRGNAQTNILIQSPAAALDATIKVKWNSEPGGVYRIEAADSLTDVGAQGLRWIIRDANVPSKGTNAEWMDVGDPQWIPRILHPRFQPQRFYRVTKVGQATGTPPTVTLSLSQATSSFSSGTNQISANLDFSVSVALNDTNQEVSSVSIYVDGQKLSSEPSTNFTGSINTTEWPNGTHEIYAIATAVDLGPGDVGLTTSADDSEDETTNAVNLAIGISGSQFGVFNNFISQFFVAVPFFQAGEIQEIVASFAENSYWHITVVDYQDSPVRTYNGQGSFAYAAWDGTDDSGNPLYYGYYDYIVEARPSQYGSLSSTPSAGLPAASFSSQASSPLSGAQLRAYPYRQTSAAMQFSRNNGTIAENIAIPSLNPTNQPSGARGGGSLPVPTVSHFGMPARNTTRMAPLPPMPPIRTNINGMWCTLPWEEVNGMPSLGGVSAASPSTEASMQINGLSSPSVSGESQSWGDGVYTTRTPTRIPGNLFFGSAGTVGIGYQGHHPKRSQVGPFGSAPGGVLAATPPWGPLVFASALANGFASQMAYAGWRTSFLHGDDNFNSKDLVPLGGGGTGTGPFATQCNFGLVIGHMTASANSDPNYYATTPYMPIYNTRQPGHLQWLGLPGMDFGNAYGSIYSKLRWIGFYGCQSLKERDYNDLWTKFLLPMPPNLRMILGSEDGVFIHPAFGPRFAADLNGLTTQDGSPMTIFDAWCDAAADTDNKMAHSGWHRVWPLGARRVTCIYRDITQGGSWSTLEDTIWNSGSDISYDWFDVSFTVQQVY